MYDQIRLFLVFSNTILLQAACPVQELYLYSKPGTGIKEFSFTRFSYKEHYVVGLSHWDA